MKVQGRAQGAHWVRRKSRSRTRRRPGQGKIKVAYQAPYRSEEGQSRVQGVSRVEERSRSRSMRNMGQGKVKVALNAPRGQKKVKVTLNAQAGSGKGQSRARCASWVRGRSKSRSMRPLGKRKNFLLVQCLIGCYLIDSMGKRGEGFGINIWSVPFSLNRVGRPCQGNGGTGAIASSMEPFHA